MRRFLHSFALVALASTEVRAQAYPPASAAYLLSAGVEDARALWINPAGLAVDASASVAGELALDRASGGDWGLRQYAFGVSSRGVAVGYQRDRFTSGGSIGTWRLGGGINLGRGALGTTFTFYRPERGLAIGLRYAPHNALHFAAAVRDIGRPTAQDSALPIRGLAGIHWRAAGGVLRLGAEVMATERRPASGYEMSYRAGAQLTAPGGRALGALAAFDFDGDLKLSRWTIGVSLGRSYQAALLGTLVPASGSNPKLETASLSGVATRRLGVPPRLVH